jgi:hypothetical protein
MRLMTQLVVHSPQTVREHPHDLQREMRGLLDEEIEAPLVDGHQFRISACNRGGNARRAVDHRNLPEQPARPQGLDDFSPDQQVHRAFQHDVHGVAALALGEHDGLPGKRLKAALIPEQVDGNHESSIAVS